MSNRSFPLRPDIQVVTGTSYDSDSFLLVGFDGDAATVELPQGECMPPLGLLARPMDPGTDPSGNVLQGQAANVLRLVEDNDDHCIPLTDPRVVANIPQIGKGGAILYEPYCASPPGPDDLACIAVNEDGDRNIRIHVRGPQSAGASPPSKIVLEVAGGPTITIDGTTTPMQVKVVAGGPPLIVDNTAVQVGGPGGKFIITDGSGLQASLLDLQGKLAAAQILWTAPTGIVATKAKAT